MRMRVETVQGCREVPGCESRLGGGQGLCQGRARPSETGVAPKVSVFANQDGTVTWRRHRTGSQEASVPGRAVLPKSFDLHRVASP